MTRQATPDILSAVLAPVFSQENNYDRGAIVWLPLARVQDNPHQTRSSYPEPEIQALAENIRGLKAELPATLGLQQVPLARVCLFGADGDARPVAREWYADPQLLRNWLREPGYHVELHFGHRRRRAWAVLAASDSDYAEFPVLLAHADDPAMWRHVVTENAQRKELTAIEEARALQVAIDVLGMTQEQAGHPFGYGARSTVSNKLRLLQLPAAWQAAIEAGHMSETHGRTLLMLAGAWHLAKGQPGDWGVLSVAQLERQLREKIMRCEPLPPAAGASYGKRYNWDGGIGTEKFSPSFPADYTPEHAAVHGACATCQWRIQFAGEAGPRCAAPDGDQCFWTKRQLYEAATRAKQAAKLADKGDKQRAALAGAAGTPAGATSAPALAPAAPPEKLLDVIWFGDDYRAPAALLDAGLCNGEKCPCYVVEYHPRPTDRMVRPDATAAPNLCAGCTSKSRLALRKKDLEAGGNAKAMAQALKAEDKRVEELLRRVFWACSAADIWNNVAVLRGLARESEWRTPENEGVLELQERLWFMVARPQCKGYNDVLPGDSKYSLRLAKAVAWLQQIGLWQRLPAEEAAAAAAELTQ